MDLIKDESDVGQVVKVTYEDGVEFLNYNDVSDDIGTSPGIKGRKHKAILRISPCVHFEVDNGVVPKRDTPCNFRTLYCIV